MADAAPAPSDDLMRVLAHELRQPLSTIESIAYYLTLILPEAVAFLRAQATQFAAQMQRQNDQFHVWQAEQGARNRAQFAEHMRQKDANAQNFLDYVKDQTYYVNPATGVTMTLPNLPGVNGYAGMTPSGNWVELVPISH